MISDKRGQASLGFADQKCDVRSDAYLPSIAPETTNDEQRRRRGCCSSTRRRGTAGAARPPARGYPRRGLATGSEAARNWYPLCPCPVAKRVSFPFAVSSGSRIPSATNFSRRERKRFAPSRSHVPLQCRPSRD